MTRGLSVAGRLDPTSRLGSSAGRTRVRPAEGRAGLDGSVGGRDSALGLVVTAVDCHVGDDGLVNSLGCRASTRNLSSNSAAGVGSSRSLDQSGVRGGRVDGLAAGSDSLVCCREVSHGQPGAVECGLAVRHNRSRARHEGSDG